MELKKKTKKYNKRSLLVIFIILTIVLVLIVGYAYAKYVTSKSGNATAQVAKWSFDFKMLDKSQKQDVTNFAVTRTDNNTEVKDEMLAPGTSGEFILELNATNTETFLVYDTKITFTNKPTNLKFYTDNSKTQELVVENDKYLAFKGFMSLEDEKIKEQNVYWEWPLETGVTEEEIDENDLIDSSFMKKTMSMQIEVTGTQVMSNPFQDAVASAMINGEILFYNNIQDAINRVGKNEGAVITLIEDNTNEQITVAQGQNIIIDTAGKTLDTNSEHAIENNGTLSITGNGIITSHSQSSTILSQGILNVSSGYIKAEGEFSDSTRGIENRGTLNVSKTACIDANGQGISNYGTANITGGKIEGKNYGIVNYNSGKVNISGNTYIKASYTNGIRNAMGTTESALVTITGGTIECTKGSGITLSEGGGQGRFIIGINDNIVNKNSPVIIGNNYGIERGSMEFYDGVFKGKNGAINNVNVTVPEGYTLIKDETEGEYKISYLSKQE